MSKVTLINPPERILSGGNKYYLPFPLLYLSAHLEDNGVNTSIVDVKPEKGYFDIVKNRLSEHYDMIFKGRPITQSGLYDRMVDEIIRKTNASQPDIVGISCITKEYGTVLKLASLLKKQLGVPIVVGGIHPSLYPEQMVYSNSPIDFVVIGEGEDTLLELVKAIESGRQDYSDIDGIAYFKDGRYRETNIRTLKDDFSISPIRAYRKIDMDFYTKPNAYVTRYVRISGTQIFTSRGCPYKCTFCSNPVIWKMNKRYKPIRYRPISNVMEEIKFLKERYHIDGFYIMDDTFCVDKKRVEEFCEALKGERLNMVWGAETRANLIDEPLMKTMKEAGLVQLDIGFESGSDEMLREISKGITVRDSLDISNIAHKHKIRIFSNIMVNLPNETAEDLQKTNRLLEHIRPSSGAIGVTVPLPKTELFNKYLASKVSDSEIIELLGRQTNYYKITDERFRLCKYNIDFEELINKLTLKHFLFCELQLGRWYWKTFFKSRKKLAYMVTILHGLMNVIERSIMLGRYFLNKKLAHIRRKATDA